MRPGTQLNPGTQLTVYMSGKLMNNGRVGFLVWKNYGDLAATITDLDGCYNGHSAIPDPDRT